MLKKYPYCKVNYFFKIWYNFTKNFIYSGIEWELKVTVDAKRRQSIYVASKRDT